jgi:hypothetical protein
MEKAETVLFHGHRAIRAGCVVDDLERFFCWEKPELRVLCNVDLPRRQKGGDHTRTLLERELHAGNVRSKLSRGK